MVLGTADWPSAVIQISGLMQIRDVLIVGAGPAGLAAGIAARRLGLEYSIVEKGVLVNSIFKFPVNMVFFTTPELLEIGGMPLVSPYDKPTRIEALRYYRRVAEAFDLQIEFEEQVFGIEREAGPDREDLFAVETRSGKGVRRIRHSRNVVFAIGYFDHPNLMGVPGEDLPHVFHYYSEAHGYYRKNVEIQAESVFLLTGYHPDYDLYRRAGIRLKKDTLNPEFNPATFESNVPGLFLAGGAICGKDTSIVFIENGRFHGEKIIEVIAQR